ncbi:MAG: antitoxin HicB [Candidatus Cloacimonetes bacterium 4572_55]|nr:MAG: antitoxin HicB [Candidatus Cloacimonetes bacterium 4572_55]
MMEYNDYLARVEFDEEADLFHGEIINIRDVVTFQGKSVTELRQAFQGSVEDYLDFCTERGEEPDKPFTGRFTVSLTPEQYRKIVIAADKAGYRVENWVASTLEKAVAL